jgi:hypothetical protein
MVRWAGSLFGGSGDLLPRTSLVPDDDAAMKNPLSKLAEDPRQRKMAIGGIAAVVIFLFFILPGSSGAGGGPASGGVRANARRAAGRQPPTHVSRRRSAFRAALRPLPMQSLRLDRFPETFRLGVIADLDQRSKRDTGSSWYSVYMTVRGRGAGAGRWGWGWACVRADSPPPPAALPSRRC